MKNYTQNWNQQFIKNPILSVGFISINMIPQILKKSKVVIGGLDSWY